MFEDIITKEALEREYKDKSKADLCRHFGCTIHTINLYFKRYNIPSKSKGDYSQDLSKEKFGRLQPLYQNGRNKKQGVKWFCQCDCGKTKTICAASLISKLSKSCGCLRSEIAHKGYQDISKSFWRRLEDSAIDRKYDFNITPEYIWELYESQNKLCALTGIEIKFCRDSNKPQDRSASIDRIDSFKGYIKGNIQIIHKVVNFMKGHWTQEEFIAWCNLIAERNKVEHETCKERISRTLARKTRYRS